jgi:organic hydroperoxide reductase OsmC/OhrA
MQDFPHHYRVTASAADTGNVALDSEGVNTILSAPPVEFGGPGDQWSPESLLVAAVADCFVLSFRAIARASKLDWTSLECNVVGTLDRVERKTQFTAFEVTAQLEVPAGTDEAKAQRVLQKAEDACLVTNSLIADSHLNATVNVAG